MTHYLGTLVTSTQPTLTVTVPTGVTATMYGLFTIATADGNAWTPVPTSPGATFTLLDDRAATNMRVTVYRGTGLVAGAVVSVTGSPATQATVQHVYQDEYIPQAAGLSAAIRGGSVATCTTGSATPAAGQRVILLSLERTTATGTTVVSAVSSGGETVTQHLFAEATLTVTSTYVGTFTASAAAARTGTVTYNSASGNGYAALILTTPAVAPQGPPCHYTISTGILADAHAYYTDSTGHLAIPAEIRGVPAGYGGVTAMLAAGQFRVGHRGGSADWPEMTMHGYTQAVNWGARALEFSVARSSDGVFFGLHDETLDRTSGTTLYYAAQHTWAEIQAFLVAPPAGSSTLVGKPYSTLAAVVDAYPGHPMFIDPKYLTTPQRAALLAYLLSVPNATDRFVWKYFGPATNIAAEGRAAGLTTWGYYYEGDDVAGTQASWDLLGMDYSASPAAWTAILAYGKPVIGHVVTTANQANQALARGATALQVAGVKAIIPRA